MKKFTHYAYLLQDRKTGANLTINSPLDKKNACIANGLNPNQFTIVSKVPQFTRDGVYTGVTKKQLMQLLATLDDNDIVPFKVVNGYSRYLVDNDDDGDGLCLDMQDNTLVYYDMTYDNMGY